jgi:hypothetical protein
LAAADLSTLTAVAIDETSCRRGHNYLTIAADTEERKVVFVTEGKSLPSGLTRGTPRPSPASLNTCPSTREHLSRSAR